jgi:hypothetical protein
MSYYNNNSNSVSVVLTSDENEISSRLKSRLARRDQFLKLFLRRDEMKNLYINARRDGTGRIEEFS